MRDDRERFAVGQLKANRRVAREIDALKDELQRLRLALIEHRIARPPS